MAVVMGLAASILAFRLRITAVTSIVDLPEGNRPKRAGQTPRGDADEGSQLDQACKVGGCQVTVPPRLKTTPSSLSEGIIPAL